MRVARISARTLDARGDRPMCKGDDQNCPDFELHRKKLLVLIGDNPMLDPDGRELDDMVDSGHKAGRLRVEDGEGESGEMHQGNVKLKM